GCSPRASRTRLWKGGSWRNRKRPKKPPWPPNRRRPPESQSKSPRASHANAAANRNAASGVSAEGADAETADAGTADAETAGGEGDGETGPPGRRPGEGSNPPSAEYRLLRLRRPKLSRR